METVSMSPVTEGENKGDFIVRGSATYNPSEYFEKTYRDLTANEKSNQELFDRFLESTLELIFNELREKTKDPVDSVGMWVDFGDGKTMDNSIPLTFLDSMGENHDITPIYELYLLTLSAYKNPEKI